jgi:hypothetical protein
MVLARTYPVSLLLPFWHHREAGLEPGIEAAFERVNIFETVVQQYPCRTGTGGLFMSCAVGDYRAVAGQFVQVPFQFAEMKAPRPRQLYVRFSPIVMVSCIDKQYRLPFVHLFFYFVNAYPLQSCQTLGLRFLLFIKKYRLIPVIS